ncbi:MAG: hypothetical protein J5832_06460, partial [Clostridia bacterium]|nr:hypothetical protein [Clostridia bacterium]
PDANLRALGVPVLVGEQNNVQFWLYLRLEALKRHACLLLLALFFQTKKSASPSRFCGRKIKKAPRRVLFSFLTS